MTERSALNLLAALRETIENQVAANDPPETALTLERLRREGVAEERVWRLLAAVLLEELNSMYAERRTFDRDRYIVALRRLPEPYGR